MTFDEYWYGEPGLSRGTENDKATARAAWNAATAQASAFKAYVHQRLDAAGIPTHPDGPHGKEGCRVGDRLDIALTSPKWVPVGEQQMPTDRLVLTWRGNAYPPHYEIGVRGGTAGDDAVTHWAPLLAPPAPQSPPAPARVEAHNP